MRLQKTTLLGLLVSLVLPVGALARDGIVKNGSMESGPGVGGTDPQVAAEWTEFGINVERSGAYNIVPEGDGHALKAFGDGDSSSVGALQEVLNISPGDSVTASVQLFSPTNDKLRGSGEAGLVLEFLNLFGGTISTEQAYELDVDSPSDTWIPVVLGPYTAPSGTTKVRVTCRLRWTPGDVLGAAYWDDAQLTVDGGANLLLNGDFETAGVGSGQSSTGIDEWLGFNDQEKSDDVAEHGSYSLKLGIREPYSGLYQEMDVLNAGDNIFMLAWAWNPSEDPLVANSRVGIKLEFAANGETPPAEENLPFDESANADEWTLVELSTVVPDEATIARIVCIYLADQSTTGEVHFDMATAERGGAPGVNQLSNPSFESGPGGVNGITDWTEFRTSGMSEAQKSCFEVPCYDGICSMRATGETVAGIFQEIDVVPGETLDLSAFLYTPSSNQLTGAAGLAGIKVEWALGSIPDPVDIGGSGNTIDASAPTDTWIPLVIDYTMPAGTSAIGRFVNLIEKGSAQSGTIYIDSCEAVVLNRFDGANVDRDDDQDMHDFTWFQHCYTGAGVGSLPFNGIVFDSDDDDDIDLVDWHYFAPRITGPALGE